MADFVSPIAGDATMKALSLWQPWATLVALKHKQVETRSWSTNYRGPIAIHAAVRALAGEARQLASEEHAFGRLPGRIPFGAIVATAKLVDVQPTQDAQLLVSALDRRLGNFAWGRFAWFLEEIVPLSDPLPARGRQGLWVWSYDEVQLRGLQLRAQS